MKLTCNRYVRETMRFVMVNSTLDAGHSNHYFYFNYLLVHIVYSIYFWLDIEEI